MAGQRSQAESQVDLKGGRVSVSAPHPGAPVHWGKLAPPWPLPGPGAGKRTRFWEGGEGCRDPNRMNRKDPRKFRGECLVGWDTRGPVLRECGWAPVVVRAGQSAPSTQAGCWSTLPACHVCLGCKGQARARSWCVSAGRHLGCSPALCCLALGSGSLVLEVAAGRWTKFTSFVQTSQQTPQASRHPVPPSVRVLVAPSSHLQAPSFGGSSEHIHHPCALAPQCVWRCAQAKTRPSRPRPRVWGPRPGPRSSGGRRARSGAAERAGGEVCWGLEPAAECAGAGSARRESALLALCSV